MKKVMLSLVISMAALSANAKTYICQTGDIADLDIKIEQLAAGKEKLSVVITGMDGETKAELVNSSFKDGALSASLAAGKIDAIVSTSDLQAVFGGAYLDAGLIKISTKTTGELDVQLAANNLVITAICK